MRTEANPMPETEPEQPRAASAGVGRQAVGGVLWTGAQVWTNKVVAAAAFFILAQQLTPAAFGLVALATAFTTLLNVLTTSGFSTYLVRVPVVTAKVTGTAFVVSVGVGSSFAVGLALLADPIASAFGENDLAPILRLLSLTLVFAGLESVPSALLRRDLDFKPLAVRSSIATFTGAVAAITLALSGAGVWAIVAQALITSALSMVLVWVFSRWRPTLQVDLLELRRMFRFAGSLLAIDLLMQVRDRGEEFILGAFASASTLGFWSVATRLVKLVQDTSSQVISTVATPAFSRVQGDRPRLHRAYSSSMAVAGLVLFPAMLLLSVVSPDLIPLLLGDQWQTTAQVAQVMALTSAIGVFSYFDRSIFVAVDRLRPEMLLVGLIVTVHVAVVFAALPFGLRWVALGLLTRSVVTLPLRQWVLHRYADVPYAAILPAARVFVAAVGMAVIVYVVGAAMPDLGRALNISLAALVGLVSYPCLLWVVARPVLQDVAERAHVPAKFLSRRGPAAQPDGAGDD